ncbi:hypothetical protein CBR_g42089 [Chara braunii]|uniref:Uncharacterized protein n=1 Tax=Chara braunii TaxID=69332 RepID=A0A388LWW7_CHABU|nr:hypothetical protein CBR_g42089 [Chara braunii]|eukprot:GBG86806.1 hypothetical protein CBR_g42089 [Chara braunii]
MSPISHHRSLSHSNRESERLGGGEEEEEEEEEEPRGAEEKVEIERWGGGRSSCPDPVSRHQPVGARCRLGAVEDSPLLLVLWRSQVSASLRAGRPLNEIEKFTIKDWISKRSIYGIQFVFMKEKTSVIRLDTNCTTAILELRTIVGLMKPLNVTCGTVGSGLAQSLWYTIDSRWSHLYPSDSRVEAFLMDLENPGQPAPTALSSDVEFERVQEFRTGVVGSFELYLEGSDDESKTQILRADVGKFTMRMAIARMTGLDELLVDKESIYEGDMILHRWNVTFPFLYFDMPLLVPEIIAIAGENVSFDPTIRMANRSEPLGGTFTIAYGTSSPITLPFNATAPQMKAALESFLGVGKLKVERTTVGRPQYQVAWAVKFVDDTLPESPLLFAVDGALLNGTDANVVVNQTVKGSYDRFIAPITAEYLRVPVTFPMRVDVVVNNISAVCRSGFSYCF